VGTAHGVEDGCRSLIGGSIRTDGQGLDDLLEAGLERDDEELLLAREELEDVGGGDAGLVRDSRDRGGVVPAARELAHGACRDQGPAGLRGREGGAALCHESDCTLTLSSRSSPEVCTG